jgi:serine/threonine protein kinase/tetratricopeptide (TPR) repeat protein
MTPETTSDGPERRLFDKALDLPPGPERDAWLAETCGADASLKARIEALLGAHEDETSFLSDKASAEPKTPAELSGTLIGNYKLREQIGEGGFGTVWVADQEKPVRRRVALKIIKMGMDTKEVIARFEQERQALAMMDHPNIAKVLDAGATESGRPFFVMELVRGIQITDYCDQNNLPTEERLELFAKVCQAVQHAHQKGIIHRDLKPSNVLVTLHDGIPVPKVIDFGIAKATEGRLTDVTIYTQLHQFVGTPAYMSPEQAEMSGLDMDTRSDIYSLGVLLYELLAGRTPFDGKELMASGIDAMRKTIREQEPVRPSNRLATLNDEDLITTAKRRSADKAKLLHALKGDLDWIVMKCLEKDRTRRYDTANGLAADIRRHLSNEPVVARPPSAAYRFQKAWRRNKLAYTAGMAVALALVIGLVASILALDGKNRVLKAKQEALLAQERAKSVANIVEAMMTKVVSKLRDQDNRTAISAVIEAADQVASQNIKGSPYAEFTFRKAIRDQHLSQGMFQLKDAVAQIKLMEELLPQLTEAELPAPERQEFLIHAAGMHANYDDFAGGTAKLRKLRQQLESTEPRRTDLIVETLIMESDANIIEGRMAEAERLAREACEVGAEVSGQYNLTKEGPWPRLANVLLGQGKYEDALEPARKALERISAKTPRANINKFAGRMVDALCGSQHFGEAEELIKKLEENAKLWGAPGQSELDLLTVQIHLAQGHWKEAETILIENGLKPDADISEWRLGAYAAAVIGAESGDDTAYSKFVRKVYEYRAVADTQSAYWLLEILSLQPQPKEFQDVAESVHQKLEATSFGWWTPLAMLGKARRSIFDRDYQEALNAIKQFETKNDLLGVAKLVHRQVLSENRHEYTRAIAIAGLNRQEEAEEVFRKASQKTSGPPIGGDSHAIVGKYFSDRYSRLWAARELKERGIEVPEDAVTQ